MANVATISGDIIAFTSLTPAEKEQVEKEMYQLFGILKDKYNMYGRLIKGDYIECYMPKPTHALRSALVIKSLIKSVNFSDDHTPNRRQQKFHQYGVRLAIGLGTIDRFDEQKGIIDGEAIYNSGRIISETKATHDTERIVIKKTMFVKSSNIEFDSALNAMLELMDVLIKKATSKQCQVLYYKLLGYKESEIKDMLPVSQSTINAHSISLGWNAFETAIDWYERKVK